MKFNYITCLAVLSLSLLSQATFAAPNSITYKNARGSVLTLIFGSDNTLTGTFTTAVASKECQQEIGNKRPLLGYIAQNTLTFSVSYPNCPSVLTFIGNIENNKSFIDTTAIVAHQSNDIAKEGPGARMISHDTFTQVE